MQPLADVPAFMSGVSLIRGEAVPVVDPGILLGSETPPQPTRLVVLRAGPRRVACSLEAVLGVRIVSEATLAELPPLLRQPHSDLVAALLTLDAELALVLRATRVLGEAAFRALDVEARAGARERNDDVEARAGARERNDAAGGAQ